MTHTTTLEMGEKGNHDLLLQPHNGIHHNPSDGWEWATMIFYKCNHYHSTHHNPKKKIAKKGDNDLPHLQSYYSTHCNPWNRREWWQWSDPATTPRRKHTMAHITTFEIGENCDNDLPNLQAHYGTHHTPWDGWEWWRWHGLLQPKAQQSLSLTLRTPSSASPVIPSTKGYRPQYGTFVFFSWVTSKSNVKDVFRYLLLFLDHLWFQ